MAARTTGALRLRLKPSVTLSRTCERPKSLARACKKPHQPHTKNSNIEARNVLGRESDLIVRRDHPGFAATIIAPIKELVDLAAVEIEQQLRAWPKRVRADREDRVLARLVLAKQGADPRKQH